MQVWKESQPHEQAKTQVEVAMGLFFPCHVGKRSVVDHMECAKKQLSPTPLYWGNLVIGAPQGAQGVFIPLLG